ncbi:Meiotic chromosome segregation protein -like protein [Hapsidospora chrysogenum ATCC 11550]|uniref:Meiotic chromosome segregation protein-like protein n=1 Tax=Hapsidospora chrysogenum (strain ATCC 11550 / CBS 779.69 / DSM 880 / IAM 14645 / JCM 23072 / IMI 49137) TaxID=857340 RepID=A0A086T6I9_HAPC1|nr:Meiotic chromosome segregation protein -like protein [Hapsidospora chrysogenum ATCC 11550]
MNNQQFRKLILSPSEKPSSSKDGASPSAASPSGRSSLGSRHRANIPMTPRSLGGAQADFARQVAERNRATNPQKRFRTSAPKGSKFGTGYVDRAAEREAEAIDDREKRIQALEESYKKEEIDKETYEKLRLEIAGGDLESTHLVKGLDFKLLERIRRGEDVYGGKKAEPEAEEEPEADVDDEFDQLEKREVEAIAKDKTDKKKKKGQLATVSLVPGKKRTRDQILAEFKASREAAKAQKQPTLGDRFRKVGAPQKAGSRIEIDRKGREVLIVVDEDGHEKRKVRKVQPGKEEEANGGLLMPDSAAKPLGMEVPEQYRKTQEPEPEDDGDIDIFDGVGDDYDPLAGMDASSSDSEDEAEVAKDKRGDQPADEEEEGEVTDTATKAGLMAPPPKPAAAAAAAITATVAATASRNYFKDSKTKLVSEETTKAPSMSDPAIVAAIKRAAALNPISRGDDDEDDYDEEGEVEEAARERKAREERRKKMLQSVDRDEEDMDMGFGTSRFEDEEDLDEDRKVKLSVWGGGEDGAGGARGGKGKRKRGPKKRKGDVNNAADVLRVMEERKK